MEEPSSGHQRTCSLQSFVSTGTAELKSMSRLTPTIRHLPMPMTSAEILETQKSPSSGVSDSKSTRENINGRVLERDFAIPPTSRRGKARSGLRNGDGYCTEEESNRDKKSSEASQDTENTKRRSIIDPASVRLSFAGSIASLESPLLLEEGLQKLYRLYEQTTTKDACLPYSVSITEVPLGTIADRLETQLHDQHEALQQCCDTLTELNNSISLARHDLKNLELHYSLAKEEANVHAMTPDEVRLRLKWLRDELVRVYNDKERILRQKHKTEDEALQLREKVANMKKIKEDNDHLRQSNTRLQAKHEEMTKELDKAKKRLKSLQGTLRGTPSLLGKLWTLVAAPSEDQQGKCESRGHKRPSSKVSFY